MLLAVPFPVRHLVLVDQHVRPDHLCPLFPQDLHQVRIVLPLDVPHDAKDALLRVDAAQRAILGDPQLGQVVANEIGAHHGRRGLATARGSRAGKVGFSATGAGQASDEHVLRDLVLPLVVGRHIDREAMIALFHQQCVARIGAEHREGGQPAAVHKHTRVRQILRTVRPLAVNVGKEKAHALDLRIEPAVDVPVQDVGRVHDVGRGGDL